MALLGRELTLPLVGALLTIAGYSINDKIVVFDRIREGARLREKGSFYEVINRSLNLTLARTILTGSTCLLATGALIAFGGPVIPRLLYRDVHRHPVRHLLVPLHLPGPRLVAGQSEPRWRPRLVG